MTVVDCAVPTTDGTCPVTLHVPENGRPRPAVIMFPDAGGVRATFGSMGDHLASLGFVVLVPDMYYREGEWTPFSMDTVFTDPDERQRLMGLAGSVSADMAASDALAFVEFLASREEVAPGPIGTTGYCMGGRLSLIVAGRLGERVGAAASFHGGGLAVEEDPDSPHWFAAGVRAEVYVGAAANDGSFGPDQFDRLGRAYAAAGVRYSIEEYAAAHGFAVPDNPPYDAAADGRHWAATTALFDRALGR